MTVMQKGKQKMLLIIYVTLKIYNVKVKISSIQKETFSIFHFHFSYNKDR